MPRAKRYYMPGCVWHITHRCHKKEFLLKFSRDRNRWLELLFKAKQRYGLDVLNYIATSNHIHLLVSDNGNRDTIPRSMQLVAGQVGQEYNRRKKRHGAYWEDRYHATAIENDTHLVKCLAYIDMNMVRTGVVGHPSEWNWSGYNEIQNQKQRYAIINYRLLTELLGLNSVVELKEMHANWVEDTLKADKQLRESKWTQSVAVGSQTFVEKIKNELGMRAIHRGIHKVDESFELRETQIPCSANFSTKNEQLSTENSFLWDVCS
ncbi:transposase [Desulfocapsa sulfexigens DSM 10523]|uniref:Transposase n=1 Tax=Desulfocapsa sulfexigens (strain DSM 10523 / SB164P1) TaxID=1167006 RepID=M1PCA7_DESSD|nr:transposase [Desulfocapsa sulfexigens]AGF79257.1 transposase [Desulfocapsa sulfexigens DSM 10523]